MLSELAILPIFTSSGGHQTSSGAWLHSNVRQWLSTEFLLYASAATPFWGCKSKQNRQGPSIHGAWSGWGREDNQRRILNAEQL